MLHLKTSPRAQQALNMLDVKKRAELQRKAASFAKRQSSDDIEPGNKKIVTASKYYLVFTPNDTKEITLTDIIAVDHVLMRKAKVKAAPAKVKATPVKVKAVSAKVKAAPAKVKAAPVKVKAAPAKVKAAPAKVKAAPAKVKAARKATK